jgi:hypothetical protein
LSDNFQQAARLFIVRNRAIFIGNTFGLFDAFG